VKTRFDPSVMQRLAEAEEVEMQTPRSDGSISSRPVWVVVVDGVPYVRSYTGRRGAWWRRVLQDGRGVLVVDGERIPFAAQPLSDEELQGDLNRVVSQAYVDKYGGRYPQYVRVMLTDEIAGTTLRLMPLAE
jgi:hypothetical protein